MKGLGGHGESLDKQLRFAEGEFPGIKDVLREISNVSPEALALILKDVEAMRAEAKEDPRAFVEALRHSIGTRKYVLGAHGEPEHRLAYSTEAGGQAVSDAELYAAVDQRIHEIQAGITKKDRPEVAH
jgi:fatty acid/phospholipid biosynthesis enzyme